MREEVDAPRHHDEDAQLQAEEEYFAPPLPLLGEGYAEMCLGVHVLLAEAEPAVRALFHGVQLATVPVADLQGSQLRCLPRWLLDDYRSKAHLLGNVFRGSLRFEPRYVEGTAPQLHWYAQRGRGVPGV